MHIKIDDTKYLLAKKEVIYDYSGILDIKNNTLKFIWSPIENKDNSGCVYVGYNMFFRYPHIRKDTMADYYKFRTKPAPYKNVIKIIKFEDGEYKFGKRFVIRNIKEDLFNMAGIPIGKNRIMFMGNFIYETEVEDPSDIYVLDYVKKKAVKIEQQLPYSYVRMFMTIVQIDEGKWIIYNIADDEFMVYSMKGSEKW